MNFFASATWALPVLVIVRAQQEQLELAVSYAVLLRQHPLTAQTWIDQWELYTQTEAHLRVLLDETTYAAAQQAGHTLQLETVIAEFLATTI